MMKCGTTLEIGKVWYFTLPYFFVIVLREAKMRRNKT